MTTYPNAVIDNDIRAAAISKGYADASIAHQHVRKQKNTLDAGSWFVLHVKRQAEDDWELRGRRRTETELAQLL